MNYITRNDPDHGEVRLYYEDLGKGQPVLLIHGWPLSLQMWEYQVTEMVARGLRCIAYDRRGFGRSSRPAGGYDYDTLTDDLRAVIEGLSLTDVTLVGFSMGGGEVVRYFSKYGGDKASKAVLVSSVTPYMLKTADNPDGVPQEIFDGMAQQLKEDRIQFLDTFGKQFFGMNLMHHPVSTPLLEYYRMLGSMASPIATLECAKSFSQTDFRKEMASVKAPTLIIHGDADKTVPIGASGNLSARMIKDSTYLVYENAPHGLFYTHHERLTNDLVGFITSGVPKKTVELAQAFE